MKRQLFIIFLLFSLNLTLHSMNPKQLVHSLVLRESFNLLASKEHYTFPVPSYYKYIFAHLLSDNKPKDTLSLSYDWQDVRDIAQTLNDLDQHKLCSAIKRCQENPDLEKKLENMGLQKQSFKPIAFWAGDLTTIPEPDTHIANLFLHYRQELEQLDEYQRSKNPTPLICLSTPNTYNPYLLLLKKQLTYIEATVTKENQITTLKFSNRDTCYNQIEAIEISSHGLFFVAKIGNALHLIDALTGDLLDIFEPCALIEAFAITPDNQNILLVTPNNFLTFEIKRGYGQFYSLNKNHEYRVCCVAISPDRSFIVTGQQNGSIAFYKWKSSGILTKCYTGCRHYASINAIIIKPDNDTILIADGESLLSIYSFNQNKMLEARWLNNRSVAVKRMALLNDDKHILVESVNKIVPPFSPQFTVHSAMLYK